MMFPKIKSKQEIEQKARYERYAKIAERLIDLGKEERLTLEEFQFVCEAARSIIIKTQERKLLTDILYEEKQELGNSETQNEVSETRLLTS